MGPILINVLAIGIMYTVMPNRRPHFPSILVAAIVAGVLWQMVQLGYVALQIGVARYSAIYGALSQLPVTLVWIYVSWAVVLAGARVNLSRCSLFSAQIINRFAHGPASRGEAGLHLSSEGQ